MYRKNYIRGGTASGLDNPLGMGDRDSLESPIYPIGERVKNPEDDKDRTVELNDEIEKLRKKQGSADKTNSVAAIILPGGAVGVAGVGAGLGAAALGATSLGAVATGITLLPGFSLLYSWYDIITKSRKRGFKVSFDELYKSVKLRNLLLRFFIPIIGIYQIGVEGSRNNVGKDVLFTQNKLDFSDLLKKMNIIFDNKRHMEKSEADELKLELPIVLDISHARFSLELKENNNDYISKIHKLSVLLMFTHIYINKYKGDDNLIPSLKKELLSYKLNVDNIIHQDDSLDTTSIKIKITYDEENYIIKLETIEGNFTEIYLLQKLTSKIELSTTGGSALGIFIKKNDDNVSLLDNILKGILEFIHEYYENKLKLIIKNLDPANLYSQIVSFNDDIKNSLNNLNISIKRLELIHTIEQGYILDDYGYNMKDNYYEFSNELRNIIAEKTRPVLGATRFIDDYESLTTSNAIDGTLEDLKGLIHYDVGQTEDIELYRYFGDSIDGGTELEEILNKFNPGVDINTIIRLPRAIHHVNKLLRDFFYDYSNINSNNLDDFNDLIEKVDLIIEIIKNTGLVLETDQIRIILENEDGLDPTRVWERDKAGIDSESYKNRVYLASAIYCKEQLDGYYDETKTPNILIRKKEYNRLLITSFNTNVDIESLGDLLLKVTDTNEQKNSKNSKNKGISLGDTLEMINANKTKRFGGLNEADEFKQWFEDLENVFVGNDDDNGKLKTLYYEYCDKLLEIYIKLNESHNYNKYNITTLGTYSRNISEIGKKIDEKLKRLKAIDDTINDNEQRQLYAAEDIALDAVLDASLSEFHPQIDNILSDQNTLHIVFTHGNHMQENIVNKMVKASQVERHYTTWVEEDSHRNNIAKIMYTKKKDKDDNEKVDKLPKFESGVFKYKQYQTEWENKLIRQCAYFDKTFNMMDLSEPTNLNMASIVFNGIKYKPAVEASSLIKSIIDHSSGVERRFSISLLLYIKQKCSNIEKMEISSIDKVKEIEELKDELIRYFPRYTQETIRGVVDEFKKGDGLLEKDGQLEYESCKYIAPPDMRMPYVNINDDGSSGISSIDEKNETMLRWIIEQYTKKQLDSNITPEQRFKNLYNDISSFVDDIPATKRGNQSGNLGNYIGLFKEINSILTINNDINSNYREILSTYEDDETELLRIASVATDQTPPVSGAPSIDPDDDDFDLDKFELVDGQQDDQQGGQQGGSLDSEVVPGQPTDYSEIRSTIKFLLIDLIKKFKIIEGINIGKINDDPSIQKHINQYLFLFKNVIYRRENIEILPRIDTSLTAGSEILLPKAMEDSFINKYRKFKYMIDKEESFTLVTNKFSTDEKQGDEFINKKDGSGMIRSFLSALTGGTQYKTLFDKLITGFSKIMGSYNVLFEQAGEGEQDKKMTNMGIGVFIIILLLSTALYGGGYILRKIINALFSGIKLTNQATVDKIGNFSRVSSGLLKKLTRDKKRTGGYTNRKNTLRKRKGGKNTVRKRRGRKNTVRKRKGRKNTVRKKTNYKKKTNKKVKK